MSICLKVYVTQPEALPLCLARLVLPLHFTGFLLGLTGFTGFRKAFTGFESVPSHRATDSGNSYIGSRMLGDNIGGQ